MPVRNAAVAVGILTAAGGVAVYTVPTSTVLLLKSVVLFNENIAAGTIQVLLYDPTSGATLHLADLAPAANAGVHWDGWVALNAGHRVVLTPSQARCHYWISGALLPYAAALT